MNNNKELERKLSEMPVFRSSYDAVDFMRATALTDFHSRDDRDKMFCCYLDEHMILLGFNVVALGRVSAGTIDTKQLFKTAQEQGAKHLILVHIKKEEGLEFSSSDHLTWSLLRQSCPEFGQELVDLIVFSKQEPTGSVSYREQVRNRR